MTFKKAFNDTFAEGLKENGFQYNKKYGMHIRFVNDELLQYITYRNLSSTMKGYKNYNVFSGILSVYTYSLLPKEVLYWGADLYRYSHEFVGKDIEPLQYTYNDETMQDVIEQSLSKTKKVIIPVFDEVIDLASYIEYRKKIRWDSIVGAEDIELCNNDALVLIKANDHDSYESLLQKHLDRVRKQLEEKQIGGTYEEQYNLLNRSIIKLGAESRDKVYADPELYARAKKEIERRKEANLEILRKNGVI